MISTIVSLVSVALLWGGTNPLIKKGSTDIKKIEAKSPIKRFFLELKYLITNWKYILPMALNQSGSVLYFLTLQNVDLSLAVPVTNSLTFVFTALVGWILGEKLPSRQSLLGILFIFLGAVLCFLDKI
ncbi:uncharacterized protein CBL_08935 [Carabus blaptoides fortunei]